MSQISDPILTDIVSGVTAGGLPSGTARAIQRIARLLAAVHCVEDISIFAQPVPQPDGRTAIVVAGKWGISFQMLPGLGVSDMKLHKLGKRCIESHETKPRHKRRAMS